MNQSYKQFVEKLLRQGENQNVEFKSSLSLRNEIGETISAFANTSGGIVLIGVSNEGKVFCVDIGKKTVEDLANWVKENTDPKIYPDVKIHKVNGKNIIEVSIKENDEKPVFFKDRAFQRVGKTNQRISAQKIRNLAKQSKPQLHWDQQVCEGATLKDIDESRVKEFLKMAQTRRGLDINPEMSVKEALTKLKVIKNSQITNTCVLMFAKEQEKFFIQDEVKCARFKGITTERFINMKEFSGPVDKQVDEVEEFVLKNISMAAWIEPGKIQRQEKWEYPMDAVREAITNAVVHRDYQSPSKIQVRIFDDRLEVWNPGALPEGWTVEKLKQEHESKPFNPLLARMFFLIKFIEEWGRGTTDMIRECLEHGLPEPEFKDTGTSMVVIFRKSRLTEDYLEGAGLSDRQLKAARYLKENKKITTREYAEMFNVSDRMARMDIKKMLDLGIVKKKGISDKTTFYVLAEI